jgi:hypothetical protein
MIPYAEHLCRAMDEQHYSHYDLHRDLWNGSLYCFLRKEYRRLFEQLAAAPVPPRIELHYVGPGMNHPCLTQFVWAPILQHIDVVHLYDIDPRVLTHVADALPRLWNRTTAPRVEVHVTDMTRGMGRALLDWSRCLLAGKQPPTVPTAAYFEGAVRTEVHMAGERPEAAKGTLPLVISEMAVSSTGLGVFWELYESVACSSRGITPEFINQVERVYNTCVARAHLRWIRRRIQGQGMAVVSADVERVYLGDRRRSSTPTMAVPLTSLFRSLSFRVESAPESVWQDIPIESESSIPPHVHRVVCCTATDLNHAPICEQPERCESAW